MIKSHPKSYISVGKSSLYVLGGKSKSCGRGKDTVVLQVEHTSNENLIVEWVYKEDYDNKDWVYYPQSRGER